MLEARQGKIMREQRLDKAVQSLFPELGLRGCRRLWACALVLVNGRARPRGFAVRPGDWVEVLPRQDGQKGRAGAEEELTGDAAGTTDQGSASDGAAFVGGGGACPSEKTAAGKETLKPQGWRKEGAGDCAWRQGQALKRARQASMLPERDGDAGAGRRREKSSCNTGKDGEKNLCYQGNSVSQLTLPPCVSRDDAARKRGLVLVEHQGDGLRRRDEAAQERGAVPMVLGGGGGLFFLFKPAGLHTAALAGTCSSSLERLAASLLPEERQLQLLTRLDMWTSGIVLAAGSPEVAARFRAEEAAGLWEKRYVTVLEGMLTVAVQARQALHTAKCATTRVLPEEAPPLRQTCIVPLGRVTGGAAPLTLAGCRIQKGARHQIRAHAAAAGYPLWGDGRYGGGGAGEPGANMRRSGAVVSGRGVRRAGGGGDVRDERFFLHCGAVFRAGACVALVPPPADWELEGELARAALCWLRKVW